MCLKFIIRILLFYFLISLVTSNLFCPDLNEIDLVIRLYRWSPFFSF